MKIDCTNLTINTSLELSEKVATAVIPVKKDEVDDNKKPPSSRRQPFKEMTDSKGDELFVGAVVSLQGLITASHLNGRHGVVSSIPELSTQDRLTVKLFPQNENTEVSVKPGNLCKELDFHAPGKTPINDTCANCHVIILAQNSMCCSKCKLAVYCSKGCQKEHWVQAHKKKCEKMRRARKGKQPSSKLDVQETISITSYMAGRLIHKRDFIGAEKRVKEAIMEVESHGFMVGYLHELLGSIIGEQAGRVEEAIEQMKRGILIHKGNIGSQFDRGNVALSAGHSNLAGLLARNGELEESVEHCWKAYELDPSKLLPLCDIGQFHFTMGNYKEGEEAYKLFFAKAAPFDKCKRPIEYEGAVGAYVRIGKMKLAILFQNLNAAKSVAFLNGEWVQKQAEDIRMVLYKALEMDPTQQYAKDLIVHLDQELNKNASGAF